MDRLQSHACQAAALYATAVPQLAQWLSHVAHDGGDELASADLGKCRNCHAPWSSLAARPILRHGKPQAGASTSARCRARARRRKGQLALRCGLCGANSSVRGRQPGKKNISLVATRNPTSPLSTMQIAQSEPATETKGISTPVIAATVRKAAATTRKAAATTSKAASKKSLQRALRDRQRRQQKASDKPFNLGDFIREL
jgi:hypothetical protein